MQHRKRQSKKEHQQSQPKPKKQPQSTTANLFSQMFPTMEGAESLDMFAQLLINPEEGIANMFGQMLSDPAGFERKLNNFEKLGEQMDVLEKDIERMEQKFHDASLHGDGRVLKSELGPNFSMIGDAYKKYNEGVQKNDPGFKALSSIMDKFSNPFVDALINDMETIEAELQSLLDQDEESRKMLKKQLNLLSVITGLAQQEPQKRNKQDIELLKSKLASYREEFPDNVGAYILHATFYQMCNDQQKAEDFYEEGLRKHPENERIKSYLRTILIEVKEKEEPNNQQVKESKNQRKKRLAREKKALAAQGDTASHDTLGSRLPEGAKTSATGVFSGSLKKTETQHDQQLSPSLTRRHN